MTMNHFALMPSLDVLVLWGSTSIDPLSFIFMML
jgi:hypothetical protein